MTAPPWAGQPTPEPERTAEGREIVATRFGLHFRGEDGRLYPYDTPEQEARQLLGRLRRREAEPVVVPADWSPW